MMKILSLAAATAIASSLLIGSALAQTAISLECSKQADEKKLKGKERKKFRSECKKTAADKAK
jgi:hypothetical protein